MFFEFILPAFGLLVMGVAFFQIVFARASETVYEQTLAEAEPAAVTVEPAVPE